MQNNYTMNAITIQPHSKLQCCIAFVWDVPVLGSSRNCKQLLLLRDWVGHWPFWPFAFFSFSFFSFLDYMYIYTWGIGMGIFVATHGFRHWYGIVEIPLGHDWCRQRCSLYGGTTEVSRGGHRNIRSHSLVL